MIQVRLFEEKDINQVQQILDSSVIEYAINYQNMMVIEERGTIYGVSGYKILKSDFDQPEAVMDLLFIDPIHRYNYFGDSLIKSTLNLLDRRGIKKVYIKAESDSKGFFEKVKLQLEDVEDLSDDVIKLLKADEAHFVFSAKLPEFFNTACRSKGN